jgi:hypothetical protein
MLTILGGLAEFERSLISARTAAGRARQGQRRAIRPTAEAERTPARACVKAARRRRAAIGGRACARRRSINDLALGGARLARNHFPLQGLFADPIVCRSAVYALASSRCNEGPRSARPNAVQQTDFGYQKVASVRRI